MHTLANTGGRGKWWFTHTHGGAVQQLARRQTSGARDEPTARLGEQRGRGRRSVGFDYAHVLPNPSRKPPNYTDARNQHAKGTIEPNWFMGWSGLTKDRVRCNFFSNDSAHCKIWMNNTLHAFLLSRYKRTNITMHRNKTKTQTPRS